MMVRFSTNCNMGRSVWNTSNSFVPSKLIRDKTEKKQQQQQSQQHQQQNQINEEVFLSKM